MYFTLAQWMLSLVLATANPISVTTDNPHYRTDGPPFCPLKQGLRVVCSVDVVACQCGELRDILCPHFSICPYLMPQTATVCDDFWCSNHSPKFSNVSINPPGQLVRRSEIGGGGGRVVTLQFGTGVRSQLSYGVSN